MNSKIIYSRLNKMKESLELIPYTKGECRLMAMILDKYGVPLSIGYNSYRKTNPIMKSFKNISFKDPTINGDCVEYLHAEMDAMNKGRLQIRKWDTLIVARVDSKGNLKLAKPCNGCASNIKDKFNNVYYTNDKGELVLFNE